MKTSLLVFFSVFCISAFSFAQEPAQLPTPSATAVSAVGSPTPVLAPAPPTPVTEVLVAEPAAPPKWAEDLIMTAQALPVIGPVISKILLYAGIVSSILTALIACLLTIFSALAKVMNLAGLVSVAEKIKLFRNGRVMYWLSYLSMFNAKKPVAKSGNGSASEMPVA